MGTCVSVSHVSTRCTSASEAGRAPARSAKARNTFFNPAPASAFTLSTPAFTLSTPPLPLLPLLPPLPLPPPLLLLPLPLPLPVPTSVLLSAVLSARLRSPLRRNLTVTWARRVALGTALGTSALVPTMAPTREMGKLDREGADCATLGAYLGDNLGDNPSRSPSNLKWASCASGEARTQMRRSHRTHISSCSVRLASARCGFASGPSQLTFTARCGFASGPSQLTFKSSTSDQGAGAPW